MNFFVESQFQHRPLVLMFILPKEIDNILNRIHERALRMVYEDSSTTYDELLKNDGSVSIYHRNLL